MSGEPANRISKKALIVWRIRGAITAMVTLLIFVIAGAAILWLDWPKWLIPVLAVIWIVESYFLLFFSPRLRWKIWRYEVRDREIEIQHGLFVIKRVLIPMIRVQHVDSSQGPLLKKYKLATVEISTAASFHEIPALEEAEADELRRTISRLARVADEDV